MSLMRCDQCSDLVDTDDEPESFVDLTPTSTVCLCRDCRNRLPEEDQ